MSDVLEILTALGVCFVVFLFFIIMLAIYVNIHNRRRRK